MPITWTMIKQAYKVYYLYSPRGYSVMARVSIMEVRSGVGGCACAALCLRAAEDCAHWQSFHTSARFELLPADL